MIEIIKFIILCGIFIAGVSTVVVTCQMDAKWRRLWLLLLVVVMIKFPVMTIGFHFGERWQYASCRKLVGPILLPAV